MAEIKPCPFCGSIATDYGKNLNEKELQAKRIWNLCCVQCGAGTDYFETTKEAIEAWNRRADNNA